MADKKFPDVLVDLEKRVNGGDAGEIDFEMYQSFNEQYKPSDWTRDPKSDDEFLSFGMDGTGGQVAIWKNAKAELDALPIVFLGSEGEASMLAKDLPSFLSMLAAGVGPYEAATEIYEGEPSEDLLEWVKETYPKHKASTPEKTVAAAKKAFPKFEEHLQSLVKKDEE